MRLGLFDAHGVILINHFLQELRKLRQELTMAHRELVLISEDLVKDSHNMTNYPFPDPPEKTSQAILSMFLSSVASSHLQYLLKIPTF